MASLLDLIAKEAGEGRIPDYETAVDLFRIEVSGFQGDGDEQRDDGRVQDDDEGIQVMTVASKAMTNASR